MADTDEYELLPHKEIEELKEELARLKEFEITPSKKMQVSLLELNGKLDKLITIFEDAAHEMRVEEGSLRFTEKMRPVLDKMNKIVEQNAELAQGILAIADMLKEGHASKRDEHELLPTFGEENLPPLPEGDEEPGMPPLSSGRPPMPPGMPPMPPRPAGLEAANERLPPLPPMPKRRTFGL